MRPRFRPGRATRHGRSTGPRRPGPEATSRWAALVLAGVVSLTTSGCYLQVPVSTPQATAASTPWTLQDPDGGADYYGRFQDGLPAGEDYFPLGLWLGSVTDPDQARHEREAGLNLYVDLTTDSGLQFLDPDRQQALTSWPAPGSSGAVLGDEVDMWAGAGDGAWTGNFPGQGQICVEESEPCGYTIQEQFAASVAPGVMTYANYGKGVTFWLSDAEAARFVSGPQDVVSADNYWFTDPNICAFHEGGTMLEEPRDLDATECRLPSNYGWTVQRQRELMEPAGSKPVWAFIELGQPFDDGTAEPPEIAQIRAGAWSSIVHGARGIVYFGHSFGGPCPSFHVLRDCGSALTDGIRELNAEITAMAPVLNAPTVVGALEVSGEVDAVTRLHEGDLYVLSTAAGAGPGRAGFRLQCAPDGPAEVVGEDRQVTVRDGHFADDFPEETTVHLYRIEGNTCGA